MRSHPAPAQIARVTGRGSGAARVATVPGAHLDHLVHVHVRLHVLLGDPAPPLAVPTQLLYHFRRPEWASLDIDEVEALEAEE